MHRLETLLVLARNILTRGSAVIFLHDRPNQLFDRHNLAAATGIAAGKNECFIHLSGRRFRLKLLQCSNAPLTDYRFSGIDIYT